jgi:hypothetical protein
VAIIALLYFILAISLVNQQTYCVSANDPTKLCLLTGAPSVLADNCTYQCIFVQLQDSSGRIARAQQDITIGLSSSLTIVGTVDSLITIHIGETFASANFTSTFYPGTTTISASATGFTTVLSTITTVGPIPSLIGVYGFPSTLPADGNTYPAIMIQLQDSTGAPARAPHGGVSIALTCSDTTVGTITPSVTISEGKTFVVANFTATTKAETDGKIENATVVAVSQGYSSNQVTIITTPVASNPTKLKIFTGSPQVLADQNSYKQIAVQLQNATGFVAKIIANTTVNIASNDSSVVKIDSVEILGGQNYALTTLTATYKAGNVNITAVANNFPLTSQTISTFGFIASQLSIYSLPPSLPSDGNTYQTIQVQLQDKLGRPAKSTGTEASIKLFSSQPAVAAISPMLTIPEGKSTASGELTLTYTPGNTTITAQASGYTTGQTSLSTYLIDSYTLSVSAGLNGAIIPNGTITSLLGTNQVFNLTASIGYHISDLTLDNISQGAASSYILRTITQPHALLASFSINTYRINVTQTSNGQISPANGNVNYGDMPIFAITPNEGYGITNITANGKSVGVNSTLGQTYQFGPVSADGSLTACFGIRKFTIQVNQADNGSITPGTTTFSYNDSQTYTITPKNGCHIVDVIVNEKSVGPVSSYTIQNIQSAGTITAVFEANVDSTPTPTPSPTPSPSPLSRPEIINVITPNGTEVILSLSGNITSQQIKNLQVLTNSSSKAVNVSFEVNGTNGDESTGNFTIPKSAVGFETTPKVFIDNLQAANQGFSEDESNYYVWFTTHFSSHQVNIIFLPSVLEKAAKSQTTLYVVVAVVIVLVAISGFGCYRKRGYLRDKLESVGILKSGMYMLQ